MSSRSIGSYYEDRSKLHLEKMGFKVEKAHARIVWIHGKPRAMHHDFFGAFDLIGVKGGNEGQASVCFVQVKFLGDNGTHILSKDRKKIETIPAPYGSKILHIWKKGAHEPEVEIVL